MAQRTCSKRMAHTDTVDYGRGVKLLINRKFRHVRINKYGDSRYSYSESFVVVKKGVCRIDFSKKDDAIAKINFLTSKI